MNILIIEDDQSVGELERDYLEMSGGFHCTLCTDGTVGLQEALAGDWAMVIVDVMLPGLSGFEICRRLREEKDVPVMIISALADDIDKVRGLGLGADDYITKPFVPLEAVARVHSNLRRFYELGGGKTGDRKSGMLETKTLRLDLKSCLLYCNEEKIVLTSVEFRIMKLFMENPGKVFTKQQLFEQGWEESYMLSDNNVMVCISKLRAKLNTGGREYIRTIRGLGYRLEDEEN